MHKPVLQILKAVPVFILSLGLAFPQAGGTSYVITTVAGTGDIRFQGDGGPATAASLSFPSDVIFDDVGNLYIADEGHRRIRRISPAGVVTTFAGSDDLQGYSGDGGPATAARLSNPTGLALDTAGNLFIADSFNHCIRKVDRGAIITTFAGTCTLKGFSGDGGPATSAQLYFPEKLAFDRLGNLYIADTWNHRVRKVSTDGKISTLAGNGGYGFEGEGGPATAAQFRYPKGVAADALGNVYIVDSWNHRVRKVSPDGIIRTIAGSGGPPFGGDGSAATSAQLWYADGLYLDRDGNLLVSDAGNVRIRKISPDGIIRTIAGSGFGGYGGDGGLATLAGLNEPSGLTMDTAGNIYVADSANHRIRKLSPSNLAPPELTTWFLPSSANVGGSGGATWHTSLFVSNKNEADTTLFLKFLGHDMDGRSVDVQEQVFVLRPKQTWPFNLVPPKNYGAIRIQSTSPNVSIVAHTSTQASPVGGGEYGEAVPAASADELITPERSASLLSIREDAAFRTNLVLANAKEFPVDVDVELVSEAGVRLATAKVRLPILGMTQLSRVVRVLGVAPPLAGARIVLSTSTPGGAFAASASLIDNGTNDPRNVLPSYPPSSASPPKWLIPSSARVAGAQGAFWTTDLTIANIGSQDAEIRLKFLGHDSDGRNGVEKSVRLAAGLSVTYPDVLGSLFGLTSGYGAILVTAETRGLALLSQTSTLGTPSGTYGQTVPGAAERDWIKPGQVRTIAGVFEDLAQRTNLILANATDAPCEVDVVLVSETGTIRASKRYALPPLGMTQVNRVVIDMGLSGKLDEAIHYGQLLLSTSTPGGAFAAYAAAIDAYVNDPQTVQPR